MKPKSYRAFKGNHCGCCKHVFRRDEYDECPTFYCTKGDLEERPRCGSVLMKENYPFNPDGTWMKPYELWETWAEIRQVEDYGCCDEFEDGGE